MDLSAIETALAACPGAPGPRGRAPRPARHQAAPAPPGHRSPGAARSLLLAPPRGPPRHRDRGGAGPERPPTCPSRSSSSRGPSATRCRRKPLPEILGELWRYAFHGPSCTSRSIAPGRRGRVHPHAHARAHPPDRADRARRDPPGAPAGSPAPRPRRRPRDVRRVRRPLPRARELRAGAGGRHVPRALRQGRGRRSPGRGPRRRAAPRCLAAPPARRGSHGSEAAERRRRDGGGGGAARAPAAALGGADAGALLPRRGPRGHGPRETTCDRRCSACAPAPWTRPAQTPKRSRSGSRPRALRPAAEGDEPASVPAASHEEGVDVAAWAAALLDLARHAVARGGIFRRVEAARAFYDVQSACLAGREGHRQGRPLSSWCARPGAARWPACSRPRARSGSPTSSRAPCARCRA